MNVCRLFILPCLGGFAVTAQAGGLFIGIETSDISYPNWAKRIDGLYYAAGANSSSTEQDTGSMGHGIRAGVWLNDNFGLEAGYDDLGSITGLSTVYFGPISGQGRWKFSATASHAAMLGGIKLGRGTLFGKVGIHHSFTKLEGTYVTNGPYSASSTGALFGGGYSFRFTEHISVKAALEEFKGVKFTDWSNFANTTTETLVKISLGADYTF